ncbi:hypothetical protein pb186bvf_015964 [Paramecium bursaria]
MEFTVMERLKTLISQIEMNFMKSLQMIQIKSKIQKFSKIKVQLYSATCLSAAYIIGSHVQLLLIFRDQIVNQSTKLLLIDNVSIGFLLMFMSLLSKTFNTYHLKVTLLYSANMPGTIFFVPLYLTKLLFLYHKSIIKIIFC